MTEAEPNSKLIAIVTNAGGVGVICLDNLENTDLKLAKIEQDLQNRFRSFLPPAASVHNPIDILGDAGAERYRQTIETLVDQEQIQALLVVLTPQIVTDVFTVAEVISELVEKNPHKPIIPVFVGGSLVSSAYSHFRQKAVTFYETPETAINSLNKLLNYKFLERNRIEKETEIQQKIQIDLAKIDQKSVENLQAKLNKVGNQIQTGLDFETNIEIAKLFGLPMPHFIFVNDPELQKNDIEEFFQNYSLGVLKVVAGNILHRTDQNMVKVGIENFDEVKEFHNLHKNKVSKKNSIILQAMAEKGVEVFIGIQRDPQFGLTLVMGSGGIYAEVLEDFVLCPFPATKNEILKALNQTKLYKILNGYRNKFFDIDFLVENVYKLSLVAQTFPQMQSIDVNPFIAHEHGGTLVDLKILVE